MCGDKQLDANIWLELMTVLTSRKIIILFYITNQVKQKQSS